MLGRAVKVCVLSELRARLCVLGVIGEDLAVFEDCNLVEKARGFDLFVAAVCVDGAGDDFHGVLFADLVFEPTPFASIEPRVLSDRITGKESVFGIGKVGGGCEVAAVETGVGEDACAEGV